MFKSVIKFFQNLNPEIIIQAPSRINLINPLDAVEGDFWMPSVAINGLTNPLSSFFYIKKLNKTNRVKIFEIQKISNKYIFESKYEENLTKDIDLIKKKEFSDPFKLIYASIHRLNKTNSSFWNKYSKENFEIGILTTIPRQSGLGGSASIIISILYGFVRYFNLDDNNLISNNDYPLNKDIIAEMATKIEDEDLNIAAGYSDRYVISRGGLCFCSYYGKLHHKDLSMEPLAVYDRIDKVYNIHELPIIICYSGVPHESGSFHEKLRASYLSGEQNIIENYNKLAKIAWKSRFALMKKDWKLLGEYFKRNTIIMNEIMKNIGFKYGIGLANNILIDIIKDNQDVFAAKLTGAGGGGSVFALVNPDKIDNVLDYWKENLNQIIMNKTLFKSRFPKSPPEIRTQLNNAEFFKIKINQNGVSELKSKE